ncbi:tripartite tricarboxylate transporter substrate binding protein [Marinactinospora thermotolerans]|uniref:Tripartite-type tricarboxylate transporter, receptor component TctC n=1 Tax=Marinactinospora thermotolerans DSM 45154 TaxID=1122192 RepID=A0A1T4K6Z8_9ACTN|nr:tripartite tricarboxylate transporter substrate binding protein [Marinactinospora thermotolerans]SJZ38238.1 Tripartite-type tricarboxylate transporter, receptor component TctC [Marinactinospora thermotolerans DSM 45154]
MRTTSTRIAGGALALVALAAAAGCANRGGAAEDPADYPNGDITLVVPYQAGGASDLAARTLASEMEETLGQTIVVENRTGGAGSVGLQHLAGQPADGYTIGYLPVETVMLGFQGYDVDPADYDLIGQMVSVPATIAVPSDSPYKTLEDLLEAAEKKPGEVTVANSGAGSIWEAATRELGQTGGAEFQPVPFDGGAPAVTAAVGGQVDAVVAGISETAPAHQDGRLRVLAVLAEERSESLADVPTAGEEGVDVVIGGWGGIGAPTGLPEEVATTLRDAFATAAASEEFTTVITDSGNLPVNVPADEYAAFVESETARFDKLLTDGS